MDPEQRQPISVPGENELPAIQEITVQALQQTLEELQTTEEELRVAEEELRRQNRQLESERFKYEDLFNCAPDGYLVTTLTGIVQSANLAIAAQLAVTPDFLIDKPFALFVAQPDRTSFYTQLHQQTLPSQQPAQQPAQQPPWQMTLQPRRGNPLPVEVTVAPIRSGADTITGLRWLVRDIRERARLEAERKQTEQALQSSLAHQRALIAALPDLIARINRAGIYLEFVATPNFRVVGNRVDLVGTHVSESLPPELAQRRLTYLQRALQTHTIQIYEQNLSLEGSLQIEEVRVVPYNEDEVLVVVRDISERARLEAERKQAELHLDIQAAILERIAKAEPLPEILEHLLHAMEGQLPGAAVCRHAARGRSPVQRGGTPIARWVSTGDEWDGDRRRRGFLRYGSLSPRNRDCFRYCHRSLLAEL